MSGEPVLVTVRILDREYRVACPPGEREDLMASARHLDRLMREIRDSGKVIGLDRIAVMAALNMAHELLELRREREGLSERIGARVRALQAKVEEALGEGSQMEL